MDITLDSILHSVLNYITHAGMKVIFALIVLVVGLKLGKFLTKKIINSNGIQKLEPSVISFLKNVLVAATYTVVFVSVAIILGIPTTSFVALLGTAGVAIGLALQGAFSNFAGGLMLLIFHPFKVGHYIDCDAHSGTVKEISLFYTVLVTPDNKHITIPNGTLMNSSITNYSEEDSRRIDFNFSVDPNSDMEKVKEVLLSTTVGNENILDTPAPVAVLSENRDGIMVFTLRFWVKSSEYWNVKFEINEKTKKALDENNITLPPQKLNVHIDK